MHTQISGKTNRVLRIISLCFLLILTRSWYLAVIQHDHHVKMSHVPQRRTIIEKADRATIQDRFGIPLAVNKVQYNTAICYAQIRQIPGFHWKKNEKGEKVRSSPRLEYISQLAEKLSLELGISSTKIEDLIHGRAALLPHTPFVIKEDLSEEQYYRLKGMEKDWPSLEIMRVSRREYPLGKTACDVIGYLGNMDSSRFLKIMNELRTLENYLTARSQGEIAFLPEGFSSPAEASARFFELQEKAYTINDLIGKSGVEAFYEEDLRGYIGKRIYEVDRKGNFLKELPGSYPAAPGKKLTLTLSAELQEFAEQLLASNEGSRLDKVDGEINQKWMRGSAVVAMIPQTGEIVALASYPRFDPNDFIPSRDPDVQREKQSSVKQWLETEGYLSEIWDGKRPLKREYFSFVQGKYLEESLYLSWDRYLEAIIPGDGPLRNTLSQINTLQLALQLQEMGLAHPLLRSIPHEDDRQLVLDLCHLVAPIERFSPELTDCVGSLQLDTYFSTRQETMRLFSRIEEELREIFHDQDFAEWRKAEFKNYLKQMRAKEKAAKLYARPYTDYLDRVCRKQWLCFWDAYKSIFLYTGLTGKIPILLEDYPHLVPYMRLLQETYFPLFKNSYSLLNAQIQPLAAPLAIDYLKTFRSFDQLSSPLSKKYPKVRSSQGTSLEKHLALAFYPPYGYGFIRSQSYRMASPPGSIFKLVTTYQTLMEQHQKNDFSNPLIITDDWRGSPGSKSFILGYLADGTPLYRGYKGGRLPRSSHPGMGRLDLHGALEQSSNVYFALLAGDVIGNPQHLAEAAKLFGMGEKTGIDLPGEARGKIPNDLDHNRTGLYSFAIGQHTLEVTPLQAALMTSIFANKGQVVRPHIVHHIEGVHRTLNHTLSETSFHDPLLAQTTFHQDEHLSYTALPQVDRTIPFPTSVFNSVFQGMQQVVLGRRGTARPAVMRALYDHPSSLRDYFEISRDLACKTGTAQALYRPSISPSAPPAMQHYISFTAIVYPKQSALLPPTEKEPELVITVFLRYRQAGLEGGPIVAQIAKKWREIKAKHGM